MQVRVRPGRPRVSRDPGRVTVRRARRWAPALGLLGLLAVIALLSIGVGVEEVREGELIPAAGPVVEVRVFDSVTLYLEPEYRRPNKDTFTSMLLLAMSSMGFTGYLLLRAAGPAAACRTRRFLGLCAAGTAWLSADELLGLHETIGHNLLWPLRDLPGLHNPDDLFSVAYPILGLIVLFRYRDVVLSSRMALGLFGAAALLAIAAGGIDVLTDRDLEEPVEAAAAVCLASGFAMLVVDRLAAVFREGAAVPR